MTKVLYPHAYIELKNYKLKNIYKTAQHIMRICQFDLICVMDTNTVLKNAVKIVHLIRLLIYQIFLTVTLFQ